jgi:hypothetical protein
MPLSGGPVITVQPISQTSSPGLDVTFSVVATGLDPLTYQWYDNVGPISGATDSSYSITAAETVEPIHWYVIVTDLNGFQQSIVVSITVADAGNAPALVGGREGMIWNFEDNNFTWFDAAVDQISELEDIVAMRYQPDPGWQVRWSDLAVGGDQEATWQELEDAGTKWSEFYSGDAENNMYWLTQTGLWVSDQVIKLSGAKQYYVERVLIDLNEIVQEFTEDRWIYANEIYFRLQAALIDNTPNLFRVSIGWADTLNDEPVWEPLANVNLQDRLNGGTVKHDFRSTGRYLAIRLEFNATSNIKFTGAEINAEQTHGR